MAVTPPPEGLQFRLLARDSVRRLINAALVSRDGDPAQFALWVLVAAAVPPSMYAFSRVLDYTVLGVNLSADAELVVLADRMFFVLYAMLTSALIAALVWDALLPDDSDQEVIGPLPVEPRTLTAARLTGAAIVGTGFSLAVSVPAAVLFAGASTTHPSFGWFPTVVLAHVVSTLAVSLFAFGSLLLLRAAVAALFGPRSSEQLALLLQLVAVISIVGAFFFLPAVVSWLVETMVAGQTTAMLVPPVWFGALYTWVAGTGSIAVHDAALMAAIGLAVVLVATPPVYLLPARSVAQRTREHRGRRQRRWIGGALGSLIAGLARRAPSRAVIVFTVASLLRSQRQLLIVCSYASAGVAIGAGRLATSGVFGPLATPTPDSSVLLVPLVLMMFLVVGLRSAFLIPADIEANWAFRMSPPTRRAARGAALIVTVVLGVMVPVLIFAAIAAWLGWPLAKVLVAGGQQMLFGVALAELALAKWEQVPFACERAPLDGQAKSKWLRFLTGVVVLGFIGSQVQAAALQSTTATIVCFATVTIAAIFVIFWRHTLSDEPVRFTLDDTRVETLGLSEALR